MKFNADFEKVFFRYILDNPEFLKYVKSNFYKNGDFNVLQNLVSRFYEKYKQTPSKENLILLNSRLPEEKQIDEGIIDIIYSVDVKNYDEEWLEKTLQSWIKWQQFDNSFIDAIELIKTTNVNPENANDIISRVKQLINDRNNINFDENLGISFFDTSAHTFSIEDKITTPYRFLNNVLEGGYTKGNLMVYIAQANAGKSLVMGNDVAFYVANGFNTAYISLEMNEKKVLKRIGSNMLGITIDEYEEVSKDEKLIQRKLSNIGNGITPPGQFFIKQFPTSQATVSDVENYLKKIEDLKGIKFDVICIDYLNILSNQRNPNSENTYMKIKQISEDLRAMAIRNDWLIISASQTGRGAWDSTEMDMSAVSESAALAHTVDMMIGIIQDEQMRMENYYFFKILKNRDGAGKDVKCRIDVDYRYMRLNESDNIIQPTNLYDI